MQACGNDNKYESLRGAPRGRRSNLITNFKKSPYTVIISIITIWAFLFNIIGQELAWAAAPVGPVLPASGTGAQGGSGQFLSEFRLPAPLGIVKETYQGPNGKTIIHIQDAHCNYSAQKNVREIVSYLREKYGVNLATLEGGEGNYDLSVFTDIVDLSVREKVADYFTKEGRINGVELYAVLNPDKVTLKGLEEARLYKKNLAVYQESLKHKDKIDTALKLIQHQIDKEKETTYSPQLKELDSKIQAYNNGKLEFKDYLEFLTKGPPTRLSEFNSTEPRRWAQPGKSTYPNLSQLIEVMGEEGDIDFGTCERERDELVRDIKERASKFDLENVLRHSIDFKNGLVKEDIYYRYLLEKAEDCYVDIEKYYPNLIKFTQFLRKYESLDNSKVFDELKALEDYLFNTIANLSLRGASEVESSVIARRPKADEAISLYNTSKDFKILKKFFSISLSKDEFEYYRNNKDKFNIERFPLSLRGAPKARRSNLKVLDSYRDEFEQFYLLSFKRDNTFIKNLKRYIGSKDTAILFTGGFHTDSLKNLLKEQGYSYIVILPKFDPTEKTPYFKLLSGRLSPIEEAVNEAASSLAVASGVNHLGPKISHRAVNAVRYGIPARTSPMKEEEDITLTDGAGHQQYTIGSLRSSSIDRLLTLGVKEGIKNPLIVASIGLAGLVLYITFRLDLLLLPSLILIVNGLTTHSFWKARISRYPKSTQSFKKNFIHTYTLLRVVNIFFGIIAVLHFFLSFISVFYMNVAQISCYRMALGFQIGVCIFDPIAVINIYSNFVLRNGGTVGRELKKLRNRYIHAKTTTAPTGKNKPSAINSRFSANRSSPVAWEYEEEEEILGVPSHEGLRHEQFSLWVKKNKYKFPAEPNVLVMDSHLDASTSTHEGSPIHLASYNWLSEHRDLFGNIYWYVSPIRIEYDQMLAKSRGMLLTKEQVIHELKVDPRVVKYSINVIHKPEEIAMIKGETLVTFDMDTFACNYSAGGYLFLSPEDTDSFMNRVGQAMIDNNELKIVGIDRTLTGGDLIQIDQAQKLSDMLKIKLTNVLEKKNKASRSSPLHTAPTGDVRRSSPAELTINKQNEVFVSGETEVVSLQVDPTIYGIHVAVQKELQNRLGFDRVTETPFYIYRSGRKITDIEKIRKKIHEDKQAIEIFETKHKDNSVIAAIDNCSLFFNQGFVTYSNGRIYHTYGENVERHPYSSLVITKDGAILMENVAYKLSDDPGSNRVRIVVPGTADKIAYATFGQFLLDGKGNPRKNMDAIIPQFQDLRHVFSLPKISLSQDLGFSPKSIIGKAEIYYGVSQLSRKNYSLAQRAWKRYVTLEPSVEVNFKDGKKVCPISRNILIQVLERAGYSEDKNCAQRGTYTFSGEKLNIFLKPGVYPRTIVGIAQEDKLVIIGVKGKSGQKGVTLEESAKLASDRGLKQAMLLDHGGSAKIFANGEYVLPSSEKRYFRPSAILITISSRDKKEVTAPTGDIRRSSPATDKEPNITYAVIVGNYCKAIIYATIRSKLITPLLMMLGMVWVGSAPLFIMAKAPPAKNKAQHTPTEFPVTNQVGKQVIEGEEPESIKIDEELLLRGIRKVVDEIYSVPPKFIAAPKSKEEFYTVSNLAGFQIISDPNTVIEAAIFQAADPIGCFMVAELAESLRDDVRLIVVTKSRYTASLVLGNLQHKKIKNLDQRLRFIITDLSSSWARDPYIVLVKQPTKKYTLCLAKGDAGTQYDVAVGKQIMKADIGWKKLVNLMTEL